MLSVVRVMIGFWIRVESMILMLVVVRVRVVMR